MDNNIDAAIKTAGCIKLYRDTMYTYLDSPFQGCISIHKNVYDKGSDIVQIWNFEKILKLKWCLLFI